LSLLILQDPVYLWQQLLIALTLGVAVVPAVRILESSFGPAVTLAGVLVFGMLQHHLIHFNIEFILSVGSSVLI